MAKRLVRRAAAAPQAEMRLPACRQAAGRALAAPRILLLIAIMAIP